MLVAENKTHLMFLWVGESRHSSSNGFLCVGSLRTELKALARLCSFLEVPGGNPLSSFIRLFAEFSFLWF